METYAAVWIDETGPIRVGKLELGADRMRLAGADERELPYGAIEDLHVGRRPDERIGGRPTLVLDIAGGRRIRIGSVGPPGTLHELAERLFAAATAKLSA